MILILMYLTLITEFNQPLESASMKAPVSILVKSNISSENPDPDEGYLVYTAISGLNIYRNYLSSSISRGCPSYPSCSQYMYRSIARFGAIPGMILGLERLLHESGELHDGVFIETSHGLRVYDPIENNILWWKKLSHE